MYNKNPIRKNKINNPPNDGRLDVASAHYSRCVAGREGAEVSPRAVVTQRASPERARLTPPPPLAPPPVGKPVAPTSLSTLTLL